jgi:hypothetical protein
MNRATEVRLAKLENATPPAASGLDAFTDDELMVQLLDGYSKILDRGDVSAAELQEVRNWRQAIIDDVSLTIELRSGIRSYPVPLASYTASVALAAERWAAAGGKSTYVPALNHGDTGAGEYDGFGSFPDLMERRAVLWAHPLVERIRFSRISPRQFLRTRKSRF